MTLNSLRYAYSRPTVDRAEIAACRRVLKAGTLALGPEIEQFEKAVAKYVGCRHAVAVANGTAALHLGLRACGIGRGAEVILPTTACPSVLNAVELSGATPVPCDSNATDFNPNPEHARRLINKRTRALLVPHLFGIPADLDELRRLGIPVIEDCAQSLGAEYRGRKTGSFGVFSVCSFYATKLMTTADGGMLLTNDRSLAESARDLRYSGDKRNHKLRFNYKLQNILAAIGLEQLRKLDEFISKRTALAACYSKLLEDKALELPGVVPNKKSAWFRYIVGVRSGGLGQLQMKLRAAGIAAERPMPLLLHRWFDRPRNEYPNSERHFRTALSLPLYPSLTRTDIRNIACLC